MTVVDLAAVREKRAIEAARKIPVVYQAQEQLQVVNYHWPVHVPERGIDLLLRYDELSKDVRRLQKQVDDLLRRSRDLQRRMNRKRYAHIPAGERNVRHREPR